jgi:hypothetical protein
MVNMPRVHFRCVAADFDLVMAGEVPAIRASKEKS